MTSTPHLIVDDTESGNWKYRLSWYFPEDNDIGGSVGDSLYTEIDLKTLDALDVDCAIAYLAVAKFNGIQRDARGFFWDTRSAAQSALRVAKAAIKAGVDRPIPDWARQALAAKWTPPKGWKP
jgi:hypothetical protein